jgi:hypothetical protein
MRQEQYLTPDEVCGRWNGRITKKTLANWRSSGIGPAFSKFGARILYPLSKLALWEEAQQFSSTKEYGKKRAA